MMGSFTKKILRISLTKADGDLGADLGNTTILEGLRMSVTIDKQGHPSKNTAKVKIYGMLQHDMDALTTLSFHPLAVRKNKIRIDAGDQSMLSLAFTGDITSAWAVYNSPPNLYFSIEAVEGFYHAVAPAAPRSYKGPVEVAGVMKILAESMGLTFEDGMTLEKGMQLSNIYLSGSAFNQATAIAEAANIEFGVDDGVLFIAPRNQPRAGESTVPLVSAATGMKSYPVFDKKGIKLSTLYSPAFRLGGVIKVESDIRRASTLWRIHGLSHHLECEVPGGQWLTTINAGPLTSAAQDKALAAEEGGEE